jgi:hypothetical protein
MGTGHNLMVHGRMYCTNIDNPSDARLKIPILLEPKGRSALANICQISIKRWLYKPEIAKQLGLPTGAQLGPFAQELQKIIPEAVTIAGDIKLEVAVQDLNGNMVDVIEDFLVVDYQRLFVENIQATQQLHGVTQRLEKEQATFEENYKQFCAGTSRKFDYVELRIEGVDEKVGRLERIARRVPSAVLATFALLALAAALWLVVGRGVHLDHTEHHALNAFEQAKIAQSQHPASPPEQGNIEHSRRCMTYGQALSVPCLRNMFIIKEKNIALFTGNLTLVQNCAESLDNFLDDIAMAVLKSGNLSEISFLRKKYEAQCETTSDPELGHYFGEYDCHPLPDEARRAVTM